MPTLTFADYFCTQNNIPRDQYERTVFKLSLYRRAVPFTGLLLMMNRNHFTADHDFIKAVAHLAGIRNFAIEAERFHEHPYNRGVLRWKLRMRISTTRLRSLVKATFLATGVGPDGAPENRGSRPSV